VSAGRASLVLGRGDPGAIIGRTKYSGVPSPPCSLHIDPPKAGLSGSPNHRFHPVAGTVAPCYEADPKLGVSRDERGSAYVPLCATCLDVVKTGGEMTR
jgi:hypothetical protein